jgi:outer membrane protein assembly factor BamD
MKRTAYVAAANRAQYAIEHYPQAPAVEEAMAILTQAYDALGLTDLRDSTQRVLLKNFPNTPYLKAGGVKKKIPWWRLWDPDW